MGGTAVSYIDKNLELTNTNIIFSFHIMLLNVIKVVRLTKKDLTTKSGLMEFTGE